MFENFTNDRLVFDESNNLHWERALRTDQRGNEVDFLYQFCPGTTAGLTIGGIVGIREGFCSGK